jgi:hypothetical protein
MEEQNSRTASEEKGSNMKNTFVIFWAPGPARVPGKSVREQPYWDQHAAFMDSLFENGDEHTCTVCELRKCVHPLLSKRR